LCDFRQDIQLSRRTNDGRIRPTYHINDVLQYCWDKTEKIANEELWGKLARRQCRTKHEEGNGLEPWTHVKKK